MRAKVVFSVLTTGLVVATVGLLVRFPSTGQADSTVTTRDYSARASLVRGDRAISPQDTYREQIVHSAVERLEQAALNNVQSAPSTAARSAQGDELRILREEKRVLETQHVALVEQLSQLRAALTRRSNGSALEEELEESLKVERRLRQQVEQELREAHNQIAARQTEIASLQDVLEQRAETLSQCETKVAEGEKLLSRLPEVRDKFMALKEASDEKEHALDQCSQTLALQKKELSTVPHLEAQLIAHKDEIAKCSSDLKSKAQIVSAIPLMKQQLISAKNELLLKETELQVLRGAADPKTLAEVARSKKAVAAKRNADSSEEKQTTPEVSSDLLIVEVTKDKVNLRSGPGTEHSAVMHVQKGTRLTVEDREGDWYRIFTPTGSRAFISADMTRELRAATRKKQQQSSRSVVDDEQESEKLKKAAKDESLIPFGVVNLSSGPNPESEQRALSILRNGVGRSAATSGSSKNEEQ